MNEINVTHHKRRIAEILDMLSEGAPSMEAAEDLLNKVMGLDPEILKNSLRAIALNNRNEDK